MSLEKGNIVGSSYLGLLVCPNHISRSLDLEDKRTRSVLESKVYVSSCWCWFSSRIRGPGCKVWYWTHVDYLREVWDWTKLALNASPLEELNVWWMRKRSCTTQVHCGRRKFNLLIYFFCLKFHCSFITNINLFKQIITIL